MLLATTTSQLDAVQTPGGAPSEGTIAVIFVILLIILIIGFIATIIPAIHAWWNGKI
jgi:hypothetical protein